MTNVSNLLWIEKYRPKSLDEVVGQDKIIGVIKAYLENDELPNMIFVGRAGVGKTTIAKIIAKELYGDEYIDNFIELNGSDERGIDVIRDLISGFMTSYSGSKFKLIFFDEADYLTNEAQTSLRRPIEDFSSNVRFIFSVNYPEKIIEPIKSRCIMLYFNPLSYEDMKKRLMYILSIEDKDNIVPNEVVDKIIKVSDGDMRRAINLLENIYIRIKNNVSYDDLIKYIGSELYEEISSLYGRVISNDIMGLRNKIIDILSRGYSPYQILDTMYKFFINNDKISVYDTAHLIERIAKAEANISSHIVNSEIQIMYVWMYFIVKERGNIMKSMSSKKSNPKDDIIKKISSVKK